MGDFTMPKWPTARLVAAVIMLAFFPFEADAKRYKFDCSYPKYASPEGLKADDKFTLEFHFDDITGKGVLIGRLGLSDVEAHAGNLGVTFMEKLSGGTVQTTTITNDGNSVHSRHSTLVGKLIPSQYYGRCTIQ